MHHRDLVRATRSREPVRDEDHRLDALSVVRAGDRIDGLEHAVLRVRVERRRLCAPVSIASLRRGTQAGARTGSSSRMSSTSGRRARMNARETAMRCHWSHRA